MGSVLAITKSPQYASALEHLHDDTSPASHRSQNSTVGHDLFKLVKRCMEAIKAQFAIDTEVTIKRIIVDRLSSPSG